MDPTPSRAPRASHWNAGLSSAWLPEVCVLGADLEAVLVEHGARRMLFALGSLSAVNLMEGRSKLCAEGASRDVRGCRHVPCSLQSPECCVFFTVLQGFDEL